MPTDPTPTTEQMKTCTCWTCGYQWPHGRDGSHSCTTIMGKALTAHAEAEQRKDERVRELSRALADARLESLAKQAQDAKVVDECRSMVRDIDSKMTIVQATLTAQTDEIRRLRAALEDVAETSPHEGTREFAKKTLAASGETK
jgi:hypothetical protein